MDSRFRPWVISSQLGRLMERSSLYWTDWPLIKLFILFWINLSNNKNVPVLGSSSPLVLVTIVIGIIWVTHEESVAGGGGWGGLFHIGGAFLLTLFDRSGLLSQERRNGPTNVNWMTLTDHKSSYNHVPEQEWPWGWLAIGLDSLWPQQSSFGS